MPPDSRPPTLTDGLVTLRAHHDDDVDSVVEQSADPLSREWTTVPVPYTREDAKRFVRDVMPGGWRTDQEWGFAVEVEGRYAGTVSLRNRGEDRAEVAYGSHPWVRGRGLVERALRLLLDWGFAERGLKTVVWLANDGNWASRKLAWRLGFSFDGTLRRWLPHRGELTDAWVGILLRDDERRPQHRWLAAPVVELADLRLRPLADGDVPRVVEACRDADSRRWTHLPDPYDASDARAWMQRAQAEMAAGQAVVWAVADGSTDRIVGAIQLFGMQPGTAGNAELGYWVHPDARGRGIATTAARAAIRHAFIPECDGGLGLHRVFAVVGVQNTASHRVLLAAGLREVGTERQRLEIDGARMDALRLDALVTD